MPRLCALLAFAAVVSEAAQGGNGEKRRPLDPELLVRANALAERLVTCSFAPLLGAFVGEGLWQSGNTIETLARLAALQSAPPRWAHVFNDSLRQPVIVDQCNDDHQVSVQGSPPPAPRCAPNASVFGGRSYPIAGR